MNILTYLKILAIFSASWCGSSEQQKYGLRRRLRDYSEFSPLRDHKKLEFSNRMEHLEQELKDLKEILKNSEDFPKRDGAPPPQKDRLSSSFTSASNYSDESKRLCTQNPYISSLGDSLEEIAKRADKWLGHEEQIEQELMKRSAGEHNHVRFEAFQELTTCTYDCVGGDCPADESKIICGLETLTKEPDCVIYSVGSNNQWAFEREVLERTPCEIHTFDCTGPRERFDPPNHERLHFHHVCVGATHVPAPTERPKEYFNSTVFGEIMTLHEVQTKLHHKRIDLLKFDIEGYEWPVMYSWPELSHPHAPDYVLPYQIVFELHYYTNMKDLAPTGKEPFKFESDFVRLASHVLRTGYATVIRANNRFCKHCSELTLVRYRCHEQN